MLNSNLIKGIRSVIAAILHQFSLFPLFMMSNIIPFMVSYLYQIEKESSLNHTSSLTQDDGYFIHPIMSLSMSICCFFGGMVEHYLGPKLVILLGGFCITLGDFLFIVSKNIIFDFFINIFFGIGFAVAMTAAVKNATKYFPKKRGLINALAGGLGGNLGNSFFNLVIKLFVSKGDYPRDDDNNMYTKSTAENYKIFFYIYGGLVLGIAIISSLLLVTFKDSDNIKKEDNNDLDNNEKNLIEENNENGEKEDKEVQEKEINKEIKEIENNDEKIKNQNYKNGLKQIFGHYQIYIILLIFLFSCFLQGFIFTVGFNYGTMSHNSEGNSKISPDEVSMIFTLNSLISSLMGPFIGFIYDNLCFKYTMIILDIISAINGIFISTTVKWGVYFYAISIIVNGCLNSGSFSMIFPHVSKIYGFNYAGELYGFVVLSSGISTIISSGIYYSITHLSDKKNDEAYFYVFIIGAAFNVIAAILCLLDNEKKFEFYKKDDIDEPEINDKLYKSEAY